MGQSKIDKFSEEEFKNIIKSSNSLAECCRKIGLSDKGRHGLDAIRKKCFELNINYEHFNRKGNSNTKRYDLKDILIQNSTYKNLSKLKERLINEKILKYECKECGNKGEWNNKPLTLQLHHINGNHMDHRLENICFLCPNCHTQTDNYGSKNLR